jgi:hypothetical protein
MTSVDKIKEVHSSKYREEKEQNIEEKLLKLEETRKNLERIFNKIITHINQQPVRLIGPPAYNT